MTPGSLPAWSATLSCPWASRPNSIRWHTEQPKDGHPPQDTADDSSPVLPLGPPRPSPLCSSPHTPCTWPFRGCPAYPALQAPRKSAPALHCQLTFISTPQKNSGRARGWRPGGSLGLIVLVKQRICAQEIHKGQECGQARAANSSGPSAVFVSKANKRDTHVHILRCLLKQGKCLFPSSLLHSLPGYLRRPSKSLSRISDHCEVSLKASCGDPGCGLAREILGKSPPTHVPQEKGEEKVGILCKI